MPTGWDALPHSARNLLRDRKMNSFYYLNHYNFTGVVWLRFRTLFATETPYELYSADKGQKKSRQDPFCPSARSQTPRGLDSLKRTHGAQNQTAAVFTHRGSYIDDTPSFEHNLIEQNQRLSPFDRLNRGAKEGRPASDTASSA